MCHKTIDLHQSNRPARGVVSSSVPRSMRFPTEHRHRSQAKPTTLHLLPWPESCCIWTWDWTGFSQTHPPTALEGRSRDRRRPSTARRDTSRAGCHRPQLFPPIGVPCDEDRNTRHVPSARLAPRGRSFLDPNSSDRPSTLPSFQTTRSMFRSLKFWGFSRSRNSTGIMGYHACEVGKKSYK